MSQRLHAQHAHTGVSYAVADLRQLPWPSGSVDAAVDKATLDTLLNGADASADAAAMLAEAARVLAPGTGILLCISCGAPEERLPLLLRGGSDDGDRFALVHHAPMRRGTLTFHAYVLRRCAA